MRLTEATIYCVMSQFDARPIPEGHRLNGKLNEIFGDHTYFVDGNGLKIIEPDGDGDGSEKGRVIKVASWGDDGQTKLVPHDREFTDLVVSLDKAA